MSNTIQINVRCAVCNYRDQIDLGEALEKSWTNCRSCHGIIYVSQGQINSAIDPDGAYDRDGNKIGSMKARCEDAPCCGCC